MGIFGAIDNMTDKLRSLLPSSVPMGSGSPTVTLRYNMYQLIKQDPEISRVKYFQRLFDYYIGDEDLIKMYLKRVMLKTFSQDMLDEMQYPYFNVVRRVIDRLCLAYKLPADRYILVPRNTVAGKSTPDSKMEAVDDTYQELLASTNINAQAKRWHRYARLLDTVYVGVVWRGEGKEGHIEYDILQPHLMYALPEEDNYLQAAAIAFRKLYNGKLITVQWSKDQHVIFDSQGKVMRGDGLPNGTNPYGVLPYIPLRMRETENHWGQGDSQLVDINEQINILLCSATDNAIMQSHGQAVAINMGQKGILKTGPRYIIEVNEASTDQHQPSFQFVHPQPAIKENMDYIDWMLKRTAVDHGLPPAAVAIEEKALSGAAKAIDNWELIEMRQDDIEILRPFEKKLFEITRAVWNYHCGEVGGEQIPDDAVFGIDFQDIKVPQSDVDELKIKAQKLDLGLWTPIDDEIDEDEGIDKEAAFAVVAERLEIRNALNDEYGIVTLGAKIEQEIGTQPGVAKGDMNQQGQPNDGKGMAGQQGGVQGKPGPGGGSSRQGLRNQPGSQSK